MGQFFTIQGLLWWIANGLDQLVTTAFQGTTTNASPVIGNVTNIASLSVGELVVGAGIPAGAYIVGINTGADTITISANATATTTTAAMTNLWAFGSYIESLAMYVHLLTGPIPTNPQTTFGALTEANYDGYAPQAVLSPGVVNTPDNSNVCFSCQAMTFAPTDFAVPNNITGMCWTVTLPGASGPTLLAVEPFVTPVSLTMIGDALRVIPTLTFASHSPTSVPSPVLS